MSWRRMRENNRNVPVVEWWKENERNHRGVRITTAYWKPNYKDLFGKGPYLNKNPQHFIPELIKKLSIAFTENGIHEIQGKKFS